MRDDIWVLGTNGRMGRAVAALASVGTEAGVIGSALAVTIINGIPSCFRLLKMTGREAAVAENRQAARVA